MLRRTLKKIYKSGMFHSFTMERNYLSFKDCNGNLYVLQPFKTRWLFRIGKPYHYQQLMPTYESEYSSYGMVDCCQFVDNVIPVDTDNPDFILRASLNYLLSKFAE